MSLAKLLLAGYSRYSGLFGAAKPDNKKCAASKGVPPRNAAYVFEFNGNNAFNLTSPDKKYVQCFNLQIKSPASPGVPQPTPPTLEGPPTVNTGETRVLVWKWSRRYWQLASNNRSDSKMRPETLPQRSTILIRYRERFVPRPI